MTGAPYRHLGGAVLADYGPISVMQATALVRFYGLEAMSLSAAGKAAMARVCARRALALQEAVADAVRWRRAAGWLDPAAADRAMGSRSRPRRGIRPPCALPARRTRP